jgi:hypothetical protein
MKEKHERFAMAESSDLSNLPETQEGQIRYFEAERDRVVATEKSEKNKAEAQEFYDRIIAGLKKRDHMCVFNSENHFKCPICGEDF